ncbi:MAG TPA: c-type cytochrome [Terriglobia bacterium]|nr:c-type cytochrome [Terriglobia bacterium]
MKRRIKILLILAIVLVAAALAVAAVGHRGFSSREDPTFVEAFIARRVRQMGVPPDARERPNPVQPGADAIADAMTHFADHCAICHGNDGRGRTAIGQGLYPKPPDMTQPETQNLSDGELYYIIENGVRLTGMPAFGNGGYEDEDTWKLVGFIRRLPDLTDEELMRMKDMNPRTPAELKREEELQRFLRGETDNVPAGDSHRH